MRLDKSQIMDQVKIMVMTYGTKSMANDTDKTYSTLSNELREEGFAKPGVRDLLSWIEYSLFSPDTNPDAVRAADKLLDLIADSFGRVMFKVPELADNMTSELQLIAKLSKEYGQMVEQMADALADGKWEQGEIDQCMKASQNLLKSALPIYKYMQKLKRRNGTGGRK